MEGRTVCMATNIPGTALPSPAELIHASEVRLFEEAVITGNETAVQRGIDIGLDFRHIGPLHQPVLHTVGSVAAAVVLLRSGADATEAARRGLRHGLLHALVVRCSDCKSVEQQQQQESLQQLLAFFSTPSPQPVIPPGTPTSDASPPPSSSPPPPLPLPPPLLPISVVHSMLTTRNAEGVCAIELAARLGCEPALRTLFDSTMRLLVALDGTDASKFVTLRQTLPHLLLIAAVSGSVPCCEWLLSVARSLLRCPGGGQASEGTSFSPADAAGGSMRRERVAMGAGQLLEEDYMFRIDDTISAAQTERVPATLEPFDRECTALHVAAGRGHLGVVRLFVRAHLERIAATAAEDRARRHAAWALSQEAVRLVREEEEEEEAADGATSSIHEMSPIRRDSPDGVQVNEEEKMGTSLPQAEGGLTGEEATGGGRRALAGDATLVDRLGRNALHYAAERRANTEVLQLLVDVFPAAAEARDRGGRRPVELALRSSLSDNAQLLLSHADTRSHRHRSSGGGGGDGGDAGWDAGCDAAGSGDDVTGASSAAKKAPTAVASFGELPKRVKVRGVEIDMAAAARRPAVDMFLLKHDERVSRSAASHSSLELTRTGCPASATQEVGTSMSASTSSAARASAAQMWRAHMSGSSRR